MPATVGTPLLWGAFTLFVLCLLALDLGVFHRKAHAVGPREALGWSLFWIALALLFNAGAVCVFGALLILTAVRIVRARDEEVHPERNPLLRLVRRVVPVVSTYQGERFFVRAGG